MDKLREKHVTYIFDIPVVKRCVFDCDGTRSFPAKPSQRNVETNEGSDEDEESPIYSRKPFQIIVVIMVAIVAILAYYAFQYNAAKNCPEKLVLDNNQAWLDECKVKLIEANNELEATRNESSKRRKEIATITSKKAEIMKKLEEAEAKIEKELKVAKIRVEELLKEKEIMEQEKAKLSKDFSDTKYTLGVCKNKNMDHEVRSLELLQEIEGLKKELKAC